MAKDNKKVRKNVMVAPDTFKLYEKLNKKYPDVYTSFSHVVDVAVKQLVNGIGVK